MAAAHDEIQAFFDGWKIYQTVIAEDYMNHRAIHAAVRELLAARSAPFTVLDLGCGDASQVALSLQGLPVRRYTGVDLSPHALALARQNVEAVGVADVDVIHNDLLRFIQHTALGGVDVIHSGFALHHLQRGEKAQALAAIATLLQPDGQLILYDIVHRPDETRETYLDRYLATIDAEWDALSRAERAKARAHITTYDFPETEATLLDQAAEAGLTHHVFYRDAVHIGVVFARRR
ncbi:MAG: class I SAM-dependent methyltransferase [Bacteroidota bacterium]